MKINAVANFARNPLFANGGQFWANNFNGSLHWSRTVFTSGGHNDAPYVRLTALSERGSVSSNDRMYWSPGTEKIPTGSSVYVQYYVRCSVPIKLTPATEFLLDGVNQGNQVGATPTETDIPANVWTLVSSTIKPSRTDQNGFRVTTYGRIVGTIPIGETLDYCKVLYVAGDHPTDYFDGSSPNCKWLGTPNNSISLKPEPRDAPVMINMRANKAPDPQFKRPDGAGGWTLSTSPATGLWSQPLPSPLAEFESSLKLTTTNGATAGAFLFWGGQPLTKIQHTLSYYVYHNHSSSISFSVRRNGSNATPVVAPPGVWTRVSDTAGLDPALNPNYGASIMTNVPAGVEIWFTGYLAEITDSLLPYFDGNSPTAKWLGTPEASVSVIPQLKEARPLIMTTDGLKPI